MRDRFMDSVKTKDEHVTEDGAPVRVLQGTLSMPFSL